jgi:hypothetical protein
MSNRLPPDQAWQWQWKINDSAFATLFAKDLTMSKASADRSAVAERDTLRHHGFGDVRAKSPPGQSSSAAIE